MKLRSLFCLSLCVLLTFKLSAGHSDNASSDILLDLKKLNTLGSVLYLAAHPDDENTRMITYFANEKCMRTAYLSLTRGDGGQNLIGPEKAEKMGLIRTQELLAARRLDGGEQFFTRAVDFGYSKHPDETLKIWNKDSVLSDVVWVIRKFRPDIIITRFTPNSAGMTHGHHTASAMLGVEAFKLASDPNAFPEQLKNVDVWNPKRIYFNTSWWFYGTRDFDKTGLVQVDVGAYNRILGKNYGQIAGASRSMHKSQGFGASQSLGSIDEYLEYLEGDRAVSSMLEGVNTSWSGIKGGNKVQEYINEAMENFNPENPSVIVKDLVNARIAIQEINDDFWKDIKLKEVDDLILKCVGFEAYALCEDYRYSPGDSIKINLELINRSKAEISLNGYSINKGIKETTKLNSKLLPYNQLVEDSYSSVLPKDLKITNPYWLENDPGFGLYEVEDRRLIGQPESPKDLFVTLDLKLGDLSLKRDIALEHRWVDRVRGELFRDVIITPPVTVDFLEKTLLFPDEGSKKVKIKIESHSDSYKGKLNFNLPKSWTCQPSEIQLDFDEKGKTIIEEITISPGEKTQSGNISCVITNGSKTYTKSYVQIEYEHIPFIDYFPNSKMPLVKVDLKRKGQNLAYIPGAGDDVPEALVQMGFNVQMLDENSLVQEDLSKYDAIITGIRAYNKETWLLDKKEILMNYVKNGGNLIVQYNTSRGLDFSKMGPYSFQLGRDRVTVEESEIKVNIQNHPIVNTPNKITQTDFDNWVQERGLYFASEWSEEYEAIFKSNDPGEEPKDGMLITAKYGKGYFTYSGISFFRQLPAGVPGAYRLFANIIALGN